MFDTSAERVMRVKWQDGLWRAFLIDPKHPEGIETAKSPDHVIFDWARQYASRHGFDVEVMDKTRPRLSGLFGPE
jgi:hypothetical protein